MHGGNAALDQQQVEESPARPAIIQIVRNAMHPGGAGRSEEEERIEDVDGKGKRLDDFWQMQLIR